jgi:TonB-dependent starch-binding outer membrane protein SusC
MVLMKSNSIYSKIQRSFVRVVSIMFLVLTMHGVTQAQDIEVTGTVKDQTTGETLPGVSVAVKGTQTGTMTDADGKYTLRAQLGATLVFSFIGYENSEVVVGNNTTVNVELKEAALMLDEVVMVGYGSTTKKEITGAVATLKSKDFNGGNFNDPMGLVQGKVAGLSITKPDGADPGASYQITLRGINSLQGGQGPLIIIDGIIGADLKNVNFQDVESFDILKDGSAAAIYGTRGSSGVIIITTKSAKAGKPVLEYSAQISTQVNPRTFKNLSAKEFETAINNYAPENASSSLFGHSTNWFEEVTNDMPISYQQNISLSGGTDKLSHRTSIMHSVNEGLLKNNEAKRLMFKTNIQQTAFDDRLKLDLSVTNNIRTAKPANYEIFRQAFIQNPTQPVYDDSDPTKGGYSYVQALEYTNPVAMLKERTRESKTNDLMIGLRSTVKITDALKWENFVSSVSSDWEESSYKTRYYPNTPTGEAEISNGRNNNSLFESTVVYQTGFGNHNIHAVAGYSYQEFSENASYVGNSGFDTDIFTYNNLAAGSYFRAGQGDLGSYKNSYKIISLFGRVMYNYNEKYLASVSLRRDGSSKFGANNKWGFFPAVSVGWRLDQEGFMKSIDWISSLKIRGGYGVTGNQDFDAYRSLLLLDRLGNFYYNGQWVASYGPGQNPNPNLKWEEKHEFNIGADFSFLNGKLSGSLDYYQRRTVDLVWLFDVNTPPYLVNTLFSNVGVTSNKGIELTLNAELVKRSDFSWNTILTASHNKNFLEKLTNSEFTQDSYERGFIGGTIGVNSQRIQEGEELGTFYGPVFLGLDEDGNEIFKNANPIGEVDKSKWEKIGNSNPIAVLGWSNFFTYKNFNLNFTFRAGLGGKVMNTYRLYYETWYGLGLKNVAHSQIGFADTNRPVIYSSRYLEDATFLKLDNIALGYNFNLESNYISRLNLSLAAQNVLMLTGYKGIDPEVNQHGLDPGIDALSYYPRTTSITLGLTATF